MNHQDNKKTTAFNLLRKSSALMYMLLTFLTMCITWPASAFTDNGNPSGSPLIASPCSVNQVAVIGAPASIFHSNTITGFSIPAGTNRLLVVTASDSHSTTVGGVTFNGTPMTQYIFKSDGTAVDAIYILPLGSSLTGTTGNIVMTSSSVDQFITATVMESVDQTNPISASASVSASTNPSASTLTITGAANDLGFDLFDYWTSGTGANTATPGGGQTSLISQGPLTFTSTTGYGYYSTSRKNSSTSLAMSRSTTNGQALIHIVVNIKAAAASVMSVTNPGTTTGTSGTGFSQTFTQTGGTGATTFSTTSTLPTGLTLSSAGVLSGTPTQSGSFPIVVKATDAYGCTVNGATYTLVISGGCTISDQSVTASPLSICSGSSSTITVAAPQPGVTYTLRTNPANTVIAGPAASNAANINFGTGAITGTTTYNVLAETDKYSVYLDGAQSGFTIANSASLSLNNNFTIEGWIKPDGGSNYGRLFNKNQSYALGLGSGQSQIVFTAHNQGDFGKAYTFTTGQWYHIACTYASGTVEFFVNGASIGTVTGVPAPNSSTQPVRIGSDASGNANQFKGNIDNVRVWSSVRTASEISANRTAYLSGTGNPTLAGSWWIIEGSGNAKDYSSNANDATAFAGTWQTAVPVTTCNIVLTAQPTVSVTANNTITLSSAAGTNAQTTCLNTAITNITYNTTGATGAAFTNLPAGVTGSWAANVVTISGAPTTTTGSPFTYSVLLTGGCGTVNATGTITVTNANTITLSSAAGTDNQTVCNNTAITAITYTTTGATGATFSGLPAGVNGSWAANTVTISGTPTAAGPFNYIITLTGGCGNITTNGTITVNAIPDITQPANQAVCNTGVTSVVTLAGSVAGTIFSWANNTTSIGLAAGGTGDIPAFTATNATGAPVTATVTVTPSYQGSSTVTFNYSGAITNWTVPAGVTNVRITAKGAQGSNNLSSPVGPGKGAVMSGDFTVTSGASLKILVGQQASITDGNGGGGGTFVTTSTNTPLIVAGGGGGASGGTDSPDKDGKTTTAGGAGAAGGGAGGTGGNGGSIGGGGFQAGAGGGLLTDGSNGWTGGTGGQAFVNGGAGSGANAPANGGFGGGGSGSSYVVGGGGGGYSGGGSGSNASGAGVGGGGGSYNAGANQVNTGGANNGNGQVTISYSFGPTCTGTPKTFTYTVNPTATVNTVTNQTVCSGANTTAVAFSSPTTGGTIVYNWTNNTTSIGLAASGSGNIASFAATNSGTAPVTATITVTPAYTNGSITCNGTPTTFTITVNPAATVNTIANQSLCNTQSTTAVTFSSPATGGTIVYNWTNSAPSIGLAASGSGNIAAFTATNTGTVAVVATITVTPAYTNGGVTCNGTPLTFTITVTPPPTSTCPANISADAAAGTCSAAVTYTVTGSGTITYAFTGATISSGSGTGSGSTFNTGVTTVTITSTSSCGNSNCSFTVTVRDIDAPVITCPAQIVACGSQAITYSLPTVTDNCTIATPLNLSQTASTSITASNSVSCNNGTGHTANGYWRVYDLAALGLAGPYTVNKVIFGVESANAPSGSQPASVKVYTLSGAFTIANLTQVANENIIINNQSGTLITVNLTTPPTVPANAKLVLEVFTPDGRPTNSLFYMGSNTSAQTAPNYISAPDCGVTDPLDVTSVGYPNMHSVLNAEGTVGGAIVPVQTAGLASGATFPVGTTVNTYTATDAAGNSSSCSFNVIINPIPTVNTVSNQTVCNGAPVTAISFSSPVAGTVYNWTNNTTSIGLAASGTGNIASFNGINAGTAPVTATITVTPSYTNAGTTCTGTPITFTITVNPPNTVTQAASQTVCNGAATTAITFSSTATGGTVVYNWTGTDGTIGLPTSGSGNIASFTAVNTGTTVVTDTIKVTAAYTNGGTTCNSEVMLFVITVNPTTTVNTVANQTVCNGAPTTAVTFTGTGTVYQWTNNTTSIGLAASGFGNIASFTATNATAAPVTATVTVTPVFYNQSIQGSLVSGDLTMPNRLFRDGVPSTCANKAFPGTSAGAHLYDTYSFVNTTGQAQCVTVSYTAKSTGDVFVAAYNGSFNPTVLSGNYLGDGGLSSIGGSVSTFSVTVASGATLVLVALEANSAPCPNYIISVSGIGMSCTGTPKTFTYTVNPTATVNTVANQAVCNNAPTAAVTFSSPTTGGTVVYNWTNNTTSIGLAASGTGNIASFTATNSTAAPVTATITVTPSYTNGGVTCTGTPTTFTITVNPTATVTAVTSQVVCNGANTTAVTFGSTTTGGTIVYNWTNNTTSIGLAASGTGNIASFVATNTTTAPVTATISVTASYTNGGVTCTGTATAFTITVNPTATVTAVTNRVVCNGANTTAVTFGSPTTGGTIVYNWTNNTTSIGLAASGTGNIASFVATNTTTAPVTATITVTPSYTNAGVTCTGTATTFTITVNPTATVNAVANQVVCNNAATTAVTFSSPTTGGTIVYNWTNNTPSIGLAASGTGNIASFTAVNSTPLSLTATITVTPSYTNAGTTCTGTPVTFTITVNPVPTVNTVANQVVCNNGATTPITFTNNNTGTICGTANEGGSITLTAPAGAVFTSINFASYGTPGGTCGSFTTGGCHAANSVAVVSALALGQNSFTVNADNTTFGDPCGGTPKQLYIQATYSLNINYSWTNSNPSIGLAAGGTGNIASFNGTNTGTAPVTATITVTPSYTNSVTCTGTPTTFTITVNPTATVNTVANQVVCNGANTTAINFSSPTTGGTIVYNWTNSNPAIGLAPGGTGVGNIPSFIATNTTAAPIVGTITVTPSYTNAGVTCTGTPISFTITVNPTATVNTVTSQVVCNNAATTAVTFSSPTTGGTIVYNWTNNTTSIGLAASGTGNIASFTATNTTTAPVTATITVTPSYTNAGVTCTGTATTFTITVNPTATVNTVTNQVVCNGANTTAVTFSSPTTGGTIVYNWTNNTTSIGLAASGTGNIASFVATNTTTAPVTATITVTPSYTNGGVTCTGTATTFTITVNPTATVNTVANQVVCNNAATTAVTFSSPTTGGTIVYNWTNNTTSIGLAASGTGNIASFTATNTTTAPVTATITVTPSYTNGSVTCTGTARTFTITVNPTATINAVTSRVVCNSATSGAITFSSPTTGGTIVYNWTNNTTSIGLAASGTGNLPSFTATNTTTAPVTATITVTPSYTNGGVTCTGTPITFTITVNPTATVNAVANQVLCNTAATTAVTFSSPTTGGTIVYNWVNNTPAIGLAATGTGDIASFTATNTTTAPLVATITVTPAYTNGGVTCTGTARTFTITVNPTATVTAVANQTVCNGSPTTAVTFTSPTTGGTIVYNWTNSNTGIGLAASGTGNIPSFTATNTTTAAITGTITVTPVYTNGGVTCTGTPRTFTITVNTLSTAPTGATASATILCGPGRVTLSAQGGFLGTGASYRWYASACGGTLLGTGATLTDVFVPVTTTYYVRIEGACNTTTCVSVTVTVAAPPAVTLTAVHSNTPNNPAILYATTSPAGSYVYQWLYNGNIVPNSIGDTLHVPLNNSGTYTVKAISTVSGCSATSNSVNIENNITTKVYVYPNPNTGIFTVSVYASNSEAGTTNKLMMYDSKGSRVFEKTYTVTPPFTNMKVDVTGRVARGVYYLTVVNGAGKVIASEKVVIAF